MKIYLLLCLGLLISSDLMANVLITKSNLGRPLIFNSYAKKTNGLYNFSKAFEVSFSKSSDKIILKSRNGDIYYEFDILDSSREGYTVDFNTGVDSVQFQSSIYKSELSLDHPQLKKYILPKTVFNTVEIIENSPKRLFVKIDLNVPSYDSFYFEVTQSRTKGFRASNLSRQSDVGYYATYPNDNAELFASKQKLVTTYLYDQNFPEELLAPLKSAVAYWNRALGANFIRLKKAASHDQALKVNTHYIDYYENRDDDGGARGIFSLMPSTGEIISSYIYVPSGFKVWGKKYFVEKYPNLSSDKINQMVLDYLTHTLAHEIGHTLGIRHNFAASTQSNITALNYESVFKTYINTLKIEESIIPSTSSMDYISIDYFALIGAKMRLNHEPLEYDKKAVQWLYLDLDIIDFGNFCTHYDEPPTVNRGGNLFCQAWDEPHLTQ